MPQDLFRWDEGGVLKHHCPICQTPLSHEKCRTTCLGKHVEWCHRYHSLFRRNWSSRCQACKNTDEQHEKRHRAIAEIWSRIKKLKADEELAAMEVMMSPSTPRTPRAPLTSKALNSVSGPSPAVPEPSKVSKKERKVAKKAAKALERDRVVTTADIEFVTRSLHPKQVKAEEAEDTEEAESPEHEDIKTNLRFHNSTCNSKSVRHDFIVKERGGSSILEEEDMERLLLELDVDRKAVGKEGELVEELVEAITSDLVHFNDELATTARNRAGFWRWANKRAYRDLVENGKEWSDKHNKDQRASDAIEDRRDSTAILDTETEDEAATSRSGSVDSPSLALSASTSLTVPSSKPSSARRPAAPTLETAPSPPVADADGWTAVGKKALPQPVQGTLKLSGNGGLKHLTQRPQGRFGALSWADAVKDGQPEATHRP